MRVRRLNVFETNSSSSHSFAVGGGYNDLESLLDYDDCVQIELEGFGWERCTYTAASSKLAYLILAALSITSQGSWFSGRDPEVAAFMEKDLFKEIEEVVKLNVEGCRGIVIDENSEGYIDHQSVEYSTFEDWLADTGADSIKDFIFGDHKIITDNDNH